MPDDSSKRGAINPCSSVIAYERGRTIWYHSLRDCITFGEYGVHTVWQLQDLISTGATAPDGYTTFDVPVEAWPYEGMALIDLEKIDEKYKGT